MNVGDLAWLPERLRNGPSPELSAELNAKPGRIAEINGDWAMVDCGRWGYFGCPVAELTAATADERRAVVRAIAEDIAKRRRALLDRLA